MKRSDLGRFCKVLALVCVWALSGATAAHAQFRLPKIPGVGTKGKSQPTKTTQPQPEQAKPEQDPAQSSMGQEMPDGTIAVWVEKDYPWDNPLHSEFSINGQTINIYTAETFEPIAQYLKEGWNTITVKTTAQEAATQGNGLKFRIGPAQKDPESNRVVMRPVLWEFDNRSDWKFAEGQYSHPLGPDVKEVELSYRFYYTGNAEGENVKLKAGDFVLAAKGQYGGVQVAWSSNVTATVFVNGTPLNTFTVGNRQVVITPYLKQGKNEIRLVSTRVKNAIRNNGIEFAVAGPAEWNVSKGTYELGPVVQFGSMQGWKQDSKSGQLINPAKPDSETVERVIPFFLKQAPAAASKVPSQPTPEASQPAEETSEAPPSTSGPTETATGSGGVATRQPGARLGSPSGDEENDASDADAEATPAESRKPGVERTRSAGQTVHLKDHPKAQEILNKIVEALSRKEINVALLGGHKYMVNSCLGVKASAGEFYLRVADPTFHFEGTGVKLTFGIDRVSMDAIKIRMRPNVGNPLEPCKFSKKFEVGGSAKDVRLEMSFDPVLDLKRCRVGSMGSVHTKWRIGNLNLKPLQNNLDEMAKNMVEDAMTYVSEFDMIDQTVRTIDDILELDCPGTPAGQR